MATHTRRRHRGVWWTLALYAAALAVFLAVHLAGLVQNRAAYASGALAPRSLSLDDFDLVGLERRDDGTLYCLTGDPQLVAKDTALRADTVRFAAQYSLPPLLLNVFWAAPGQDHTVRQMAYATGAGHNTFLLPAAGGQHLRIDPGAAAGNVITVEAIVINEQRPLWRFFVPGAGEAALLAVVPGLCAAGSVALARLLPAPAMRRRRNGKKAGERHG